MKKIIIVLLLFSFMPAVFGEIDSACLDRFNIDFEKYPKSLLVDVSIINNGDGSDEYSHIGGYFSYEIEYKNVGDENFSGTLTIDVNSPSGLYNYSKNKINFDLNVEDKNSFRPYLDNRSEEVNIYEFISLGTHKIIIRSEGIDFFRCLENNYVHYQNEIVYAFDPMPQWQKKAIITQNDILDRISTIGTAIDGFLSPPNQIIGVIIAGLIALFVGIKRTKILIYKLFKLFIVSFSVLYGLFVIFLAYIIFTAPGATTLNFVLSSILFLLALWLLDVKIPELILFYKIGKLRENFKINSFCLNCYSEFYKSENQDMCHNCSSAEIVDIDKIDIVKPLRMSIYKKLKSFWKSLFKKD